jgi:hypothetical protein
MISQAHQCLGEILCIQFSPGILAFTLETQKLTRIEFIAIFEVEISIGDVFACTPFIIGEIKLNTNALKWSFMKQ